MTHDNDKTARQLPPYSDPDPAELVSDVLETPANGSDQPQPHREDPQPMLDIHAPHQGLHTWKDFFIHIATIAVGLLIAIGLEQSVEYVHHRHQLRDARDQLALELDGNREVLRKNMDSIKELQTELDRDMAVIRDYQSSKTAMNGKLNYSHSVFRPHDAAWLSTKQNGVLALMPYDEIESHNYFYELLDDTMASIVGFTTPLKVAEAISRRSPDGNLAPQDVEALIAATSEAQGKVAITAMLLRIEQNSLQEQASVSQGKK
ncbi:MAG TPA: hypothetical protein VGI93_05875 [Steroidobacteraceae bacterium]